MYEPKPGDIGLSSSTGVIGKSIRVMQAAIGDWSIYTHAFLVLDSGFIVEAMPKGAQISTVDKYIGKPHTTFSSFDLTPDQRVELVRQGLSLEGTPYSFLDYLAMGATHWNIRPEPIRNRVISSGHLICSSLVAVAYRRAGMDLFPDRPKYLGVTPGDLGFYIAENSRKTFKPVA